MRKVTVKIIKETKKSKLVEYKGQRGWMMNRSVNSDNQVNLKTFEKSVEYYKKSESIYKSEQDYKNSYHKVNVIKETDKGIMVGVKLRCYHTDGVKRDVIWFPKSQCNENLEPKGWLMNIKRDELVSQHGRNFEVEF